MPWYAKIGKHTRRHRQNAPLSAPSHSVVLGDDDENVIRVAFPLHNVNRVANERRKAGRGEIEQKESNDKGGGEGGVTTKTGTYVQS